MAKAKAKEKSANKEEVTFFATPAAWRRWLERHHATASELWVGFHKRHTNTKSITWPESVDEALCFGWIDGRRQSIDDTAYKIRFTPRKPTSMWSAVNVARVRELTKETRMQPAGHAAFAKRTPEKTGVYAFERTKDAKLTPEWQRRFEKNAKAWSYWKSKPPWYQRTALHWVVSAKKEETRLRRFEQLLLDCENARTIKQLTTSSRA
jgi:uncharacterized protein YdeI (YjbR/CyaY-like superfamily)